MIYCIGKLVFENGAINPRYEDDPETIVIGGDKGDVWAAYAIQDGNNVILSGAELHTSLEGLTLDEAAGIAYEIVQFCYESIGSDTFIPGTIKT